jgi:hypothetical protein
MKRAAWLVFHSYPINASPQRFRTLARLPERIEIVQAVEAPLFERHGVEQQCTLAHLAGAGQNNDWVILAGFLQGWSDPAGVIGFRW